MGFRLGAGQPHTAKIVAYKTIYLGILIAMFSTAGLYVLAEFLPRWLTPDPTLQKMIFDVLPLVSPSMLFESCRNLDIKQSHSFVLADTFIRSC